ncbi:MAG: Smr/MutS family protein, partial [Nitrospirae bacterium]|nr:Smr/MutS family protein [Nitrospirota bacterium]
LEEIKRQKTTRLLKVNDEAQRQLTTLRAEAKEIRAELSKADTLRAKQLVINIDKRLANIRQERRALQNADTPEIDNLTPGASIHVKGLDADGRVISVNIKKGRATVLVRDREVELPISELAHAVEQPAVAPMRPQPGSGGLMGLTSYIPYEINLVGQRVDPALSALERYLNDASIADYGLGTGTLSRAVREHLDGHPLVKSFKKGDRDTGGEAVTIVSLNT